METKSRYEVIADLEKQKRTLVIERDSYDDETKRKDLTVLNLERAKQDLSRQKEDFEMRQVIEKENLERDKNDFEFKMKNTEEKVNCTENHF